MASVVNTEIIWAKLADLSKGHFVVLFLFDFCCQFLFCWGQFVVHAGALEASGPVNGN